MTYTGSLLFFFFYLLSRPPQTHWCTLFLDISIPVAQLFFLPGKAFLAYVPIYGLKAKFKCSFCEEASATLFSSWVPLPFPHTPRVYYFYLDYTTYELSSLDYNNFSMYQPSHSKHLNHSSHLQNIHWSDIKWHQQKTMSKWQEVCSNLKVYWNLTWGKHAHPGIHLYWSDVAGWYSTGLWMVQDWFLVLKNPFMTNSTWYRSRQQTHNMNSLN